MSQQCKYWSLSQICGIYLILAYVASMCFNLGSIFFVIDLYDMSVFNWKVCIKWLTISMLWWTSDKKLDLNTCILIPIFVYWTPLRSDLMKLFEYHSQIDNNGKQTNTRLEFRECWEIRNLSIALELGTKYISHIYFLSTKKGNKYLDWFVVVLKEANI